MNGSGEAFDLVVRGGRVIDPARNLDAEVDVGVRLGRIAVIGQIDDSSIRTPRDTYPPDLGTVVIDARGLLVVPGLIDLHAHVYAGVCPLTVLADETSSRSGVATVVSAGDAGAHTIEGFRALVVNASRTRVLAFLHISTIGLAGWPEGEALDLAYLNVDKAVRAAQENSDFVVGIKVREQAPLVSGDHGIEPVRLAVQAGDRAGIPVMVHIADLPVPLEELLDALRPGDIITHCFTPVGPGVLGADGRLLDAALRGRERGIVFDVGHGFGSFAYDVAGPATEDGFWPDTISTDLHSLSASGPVGDLPTTMSKFLDLGMPLYDVVAAVTARPARVIGRTDLGTLAEGGPADITVLELADGDFTLADATGATRRATRALRLRHAIRDGIPWGSPLPHPGRGAFSRPPDRRP